MLDSKPNLFIILFPNYFHHQLSSENIFINLVFLSIAVRERDRKGKRKREHG